MKKLTSLQLPLLYYLQLLFPYYFAYEDQHLALANQQATMIKKEINNDSPANDNSISIVPKVAFLNFYDDERTHNALDTLYSHNDTQIFSRFVELVNSQINFNKNDAIHAIPL